MKLNLENNVVKVQKNYKKRPNEIKLYTKKEKLKN